MSKLPQISGKECIKTLGKAGFYIKRQKGSHIILCRHEPFAEVVVPDYKNLDKGTLRAIIRQAELDVDETLRSHYLFTPTTNQIIPRQTM